MSVEIIEAFGLLDIVTRIKRNTTTTSDRMINNKQQQQLTVKSKTPIIQYYTHLINNVKR